MRLTDEQAELLLPVAHVAAQATYRRVPDGLGYQDLKQEALYWASKHAIKVTKWLTDLEEQEYGKLLYKAMRDACMAATQREQARQHPERYSAQRYYTVDQIREELLPCLWDRDAWANRPSTDRNEQRGSSLANERGTWMAMLADVADAYRKLPRDLQQILLLHHGLQWTIRELELEMKLTEDQVKKALQKGVRAIHHRLGGDEPLSCPRDCECKVGPAVAPRQSRNGERLAGLEKEYEG